MIKESITRSQDSINQNIAVHSYRGKGTYKMLVFFNNETDLVKAPVKEHILYVLYLSYNMER